MVLLNKHFTKEHIHYILVYNQRRAFGSIIIIEKDDTSEIDNLFVFKSFQRKGIGQHFIMESFHSTAYVNYVNSFLFLQSLYAFSPDELNETSPAVLSAIFALPLSRLNHA